MARVRVEIYREKARLYGIRQTTFWMWKVNAEILRGSKLRILEHRFKTGHLYRSGSSRVQTYTYRVIGKVGYSAHHALVVHRGARPHLIRPRRKTGLLFYWPAGVGRPPLTVGRMVCFKGVVHHPGTKGERYLTIPLLLASVKHNMRPVIYGDIA